MKVRFPLMIFVLFPALAFGQADFTRQILSDGNFQSYRGEGKRRRPASDTGAKGSKTEVLVEVPPAVPKTNEPIVEPGLAKQAKALFDDSTQVPDFYREHIQRDDVRLNKVEVQVVPGYSSIESHSDYSYRNFKTAFTNVDLRSNVWFAPLIGVSGALRFSLGGSLQGGSSLGAADPVRDESMDLGLKTRHFFGLSDQSAQLEFGLHYLDHLFGVPSESTSHMRTHTSGFAASTRFVCPTSGRFAWVVGALLAPQMQHQELAAVTDAVSGQSSNSTLFGVDIGGEWRLSREHQILYGVAFTSERSAFSGAASVTDPQTNSTPSNVTVTNNAINFSFGYRWGH